MKKIIATAAGLMLVGAMASTAMAETVNGVSFSGDARLRAYTRVDYDLDSNKDDDNQKLNSRTRLAVSGDFENTFAHMRLKIGDGNWDGGSNTGGVEVETDYAYLGATFGDTTVSAGRQIAGWGHKFMSWDARKDRLKAVTKVSEETTVLAYYDKNDEEIDNVDTRTLVYNADGTVGYTGTLTDNSIENATDNDKNAYAAGWIQNWGMADTKLLVIYSDDETMHGDGSLSGTLAFTVNPSDAMTVVGEVSYKESTGSADDQIGGFAGVVLPMGDITVILPVAFTQDGFQADDDFKPTYMFGTADPMGILDFGGGGDTIAAAPSVDYKMGDLTLHGGIAYAQIDGFADVTEVDAGVTMGINKNAYVALKGAYLSVSPDKGSADDPMVAMVEAGIQF